MTDYKYIEQLEEILRKNSEKSVEHGRERRMRLGTDKNIHLWYQLLMRCRHDRVHTRFLIHVEGYGGFSVDSRGQTPEEAAARLGCIPEHVLKELIITWKGVENVRIRHVKRLRSIKEGAL